MHKVFTLFTLLAVSTTTMADEIWNAPVDNTPNRAILVVPNRIEPANMADIHAKSLDIIMSTDKNILLHINSIGGSLNAGLNMANLIKQYPYRFVCSIGDYVISAAFLIMSQCKKVIRSNPSAFLMWHNISLKMSVTKRDVTNQPAYSFGSDKIRIHANSNPVDYAQYKQFGIIKARIHEMARLQKLVDGMIIDAMGITDVKTFEAYRDADEYMTWEDLQLLISE